MDIKKCVGWCAVSGMLATSGTVLAELVECDQVNQNGNVNAPGGCIARTLEDQIGPGQGDIHTFGSSVYLIKRDPARSIRRGRQLFQRKFTRSEGHGPRINFDSTGDITQDRILGAGVGDSCATCHGRPRGSAGFGGDVNTRPDSRDAPHLFGLGIVEQLAEEMTEDLRAIRAAAIAEAQSSGTPAGGSAQVKKPLKTKGVSFGFIKAFSDGTVDTSLVEGVDSDLRVRPFFHEGSTASIREFIVGALNAEMGLQVVDPILCAVTDPVNPQSQVSPAGFQYDPSQDNFERPAVCDEQEDPDGDGINDELDTAVIDHLEFYLLNYFKPGHYEISKTARKGKKLLKKIGCTSCHVPNLKIESDRRIADVETRYDPERGIFNDLFAEASLLLGDPVDDGDEFPQLLPAGNSFVVKHFYSDLKRHDLGPAFHEREFDDATTGGANRVTEFVTEPLWGVGSTSPYGHDGRSINLDAVIRRHGGEAERSAKAYKKLSEKEQISIQLFLQTLILFPPDDTASDLNPGNPGTSDPQTPSEHGSINLGALFQILSLGGE